MEIAVIVDSGVFSFSSGGDAEIAVRVDSGVFSLSPGQDVNGTGRIYCQAVCQAA